MTEFQKLQRDLEGLTDQEREAWSLRFRYELGEAREAEDILDTLTPEQQERLKGLIQEGMSSGAPAPLDVGAAIRRLDARWKASHDE